ncbi:MAG TPA: hypothetical protein VLC09_04070 [Polyangiaceae bacterium]|nr:hypothetical protein [Polyangiaceae bacterium]
MLLGFEMTRPGWAAVLVGFVGFVACGSSVDDGGPEDASAATGGTTGNDADDDADDGAPSHLGGGGAGIGLEQAVWVFEATNSGIFAAYAGEQTADETEPMHDHYAYTAPCEGGGTVDLINDKYETETELDVGTAVATFHACVQRGLRIDGVLHDAFEGKFNNAENTFTGTLTYGSGIGDCTWDAVIQASGLATFELVSGTVCGVSATEIEAEREVLPSPF